MTDFEDCCRLHMSFHLWRKQLHHSSLFDWTLFSMFSRLWQCNYNSLTSILFDSRVWKKDINFIDLKNISKRWNSGNFSISRLRSHLKCSAHTDPHGPGSTRGQEGSGGVSLAAATTQGAREHQTTSERGVHSLHTRDREARAWAGLGTPEDRTRVWGHVEDRAEVLWIRQVRRQGTAVQCLRPRIIALRSRPPGGTSWIEGAPSATLPPPPGLRHASLSPKSPLKRLPSGRAFLVSSLAFGLHIYSVSSHDFIHYASPKFLPSSKFMSVN